MSPLGDITKRLRAVPAVNAEVTSCRLRLACELFSSLLRSSFDRSRRLAAIFLLSMLMSYRRLRLSRKVFLSLANAL
jgi:hypothetical protein